MVVVSGVQPHSPGLPPPPHVALLLEHEQLSVPLQPSETAPQRRLPSAAVAVAHVFGVQHLADASSHEAPLAQVQSTKPPQPSASEPH